MIEMGGLVDGVKCFPAWSTAAAKSCDSCKTTGPMSFCQTHSAFLCIPCDDKIHGGGARHARALMCEVCEQAPATVSCKADAAALCFTCDRDIHSANPLARRHERISLVPLVDCGGSVVRSTTASFLFPGATDDDPVHDTSDWILPTGKTAGEINPTDIKSIEQLFSDADQLLDFDCAIPTDPILQGHVHNSGTDSVVPVQSRKPPVPAQAINHSPDKYFEINFISSGMNSYGNGYNPQSVSHSVSSSSMDVGVVPEGNSMSEISYPFGLQMNVAVENQAPALSSSDREARVVRYREKRKNRKFEKTIRYASRKAYAETRPRIKGRFAKRTEGDGDVDRWCTVVGTGGGGSAHGHVGDAEFGVVPSF